MRPMLGDDAFARPRPADNDTPTALHPVPGPQMSYVLGDESTVDVAMQQSSTAFQRPRESKRNTGQEISGAAAAGGPRLGDKDNKDGRPSSSKGPVDTLRNDDFTLLRPDSPTYKATGASNPSQPMTPILFGASATVSALSSASSRRNSLSGSLDLGSQALSTDGETDKDSPSNMMDSGSAPQLIMPSIKMPSRRPFTERGKSMGRLKVLVAGDSGIGKTSLVKAIVQSCEHIVHVDPITPSPASSVIRPAAPRRGRRRHPSRSDLGTTQITEIFASTKPYPEWWSDLDDSRILKRRKSLGDTVLDRNICFVDTPGYGCGSSAMDTISPVVQYVESHLQRMYSNTLADGDVLNMLGGDGGVQVDVVFYMISHRLKPVDLQYLRQLSALTNVIPLLARADLMSPDQVTASKEQINSQLQEADIRPFGFAIALPGSTAPRPGCPYAISNATGSDHDVMDASLLMSSDYVQPLIPTELDALVDQVFTQEGASWLRHSAAKKYIQWRKDESTSRPMELYQPLGLSSSYAQLSASQGLSPALGAASSFAVARVADHTQREERLARIRLANWAADLQKSLDNERAGYERLARGERAVWLTERLNECVQDGTLVSVPGRAKSMSETDGNTRLKRGSSRGVSTKTMHHQDPLGLLEVAADLRHKGLVALEVLGSLSVLGGLALWISRHYWHFQPYEWVAGEWDKFWSGGR